MQKYNFNLGGEQSGHIILGKFATTGDGLLVALETLFSMKKGNKASEIFNILFPGGKGSLSLTNKENILESGIDITAQPRGKKVKKISLLSGGERSLAAIAFLFAIFKAFFL